MSGNVPAFLFEATLKVGEGQDTQHPVTGLIGQAFTLALWLKWTDGCLGICLYCYSCCCLPPLLEGRHCFGSEAGHLGRARDYRLRGSSEGERPEAVLR